ncbi:hypothetical protein Tco_0524002 [Tanacetum coccineum]
MAESSSNNPSSPEITLKEEPVTLDKHESPNPFLPATQVEFTFEEIAFTTNNEVALLYPSHPNQAYFKDVSDFISKCCLKEAFTKAPTQYKEYLSEFWYTTKTLEDSKTLKPNQPEEPPFTTHMKAIYKLDVHVVSKAPKPSSQTEEIEASKSKTGQSETETKSSSAKDKSLSHLSPPTLVVDEMHKEAHQVAGGLTSLGATSEERAHPQISSGSNPSVLVDTTKSARDELKTAHTDFGTNEESRDDDISKKIKLEDLSEILKDTRSAFFTPESLQDDPIIVTDESKEEEAKDTSVPPPPSPKSAQIQELMTHVLLLKSQKDELEQQKASAKAEPELSKLLASHNFASSLPTELKELPLKFTELSREIKELKFATVVENASEAMTKDVPLVGQVTASPAEGEKNTKDAETNLKDELVDLLGTNVVTQYYNKKLLFDKYCDKMLKRKKSPKITKCEVKKGPITLKIYREDGSEEVILNLKVSDLHLAKWREVIQACPDKSKKGWKTIYDLVKIRLDQLTQTEQELKIDLKELKIDLNKPLKEQDPLNELNELANKKRKRTSDLKDHSRSTKKHKSSSSA